MPRIVGIRRLVDEGGVVHAHHNGTFDVSVEHRTACGIRFRVLNLPGESTYSSLHQMFQTTNTSGTPIVLRGTPQDLEVNCMSCLVGMRTWSRE